MADAYKETGLWARSLGAEVESNQREHFARLNSAYSILRGRASHLTTQIAKSLPNLTIHDVTHLDALWETADLIAGPMYPLNPMEGFVLGGAILLHDAALCFEAYEDGAAGLRRTDVWKDCFALERVRNPLESETDAQANADFAALRSLHARQAARLCERSWVALDGGQIFLLDDYELRTTYGQIIGLIAASHHWPIEDVSSKLLSQVNAPGSFPREWRVDAVKIACLLRCADAAHIDRRRAPDFLYALARKQGLSANHWKAQNWLARVDVDQSDNSGSSLLFTSNHDFSRDDVDAWWIAYDAVCLVDMELRASNNLLQSRSQRDISPPFKSQRVSGAFSPEALSKSIQVQGWKPCDVKIHVGNVENLVKSLGGANLYGDSDQIGVAIRELIQNARDAVVARRALQLDYDGKIKVQLTRLKSNEIYLEVEDDGIGMSERVLCGPFLDFGSSFWISDLVKEEFPGLRSSRFQPVGRFGIGFYAVFMVSARVAVSSRRFDTGLEETCTLSFPHGITLRPTLSRGRAEEFGTYLSTRVSFRLNDSTLDPGTLKITSGRLGQADLQVPFEDYLAALVAGLDVRVVYQETDHGDSIEVHSPIVSLSSLASRQRWLERLSFAKNTENKSTQSDIQRHAHRLRLLQNGDQIYGLAALSTRLDFSANFLSIATVGGLAVTVHNRDASRYIGYLDHEAKSAKRDAVATVRAPADVLQNWADEQINILNAAGATPEEWHAVTCGLCDLNIDPLPVARVPILFNNVLSIMRIYEVFELARSNGLAVLKWEHLSHIDTHHSVNSFKIYPTFFPLKNSGFLSLELTNGVPKQEFSFIGCLYRYAVSQRCQLHFEERQDGGRGAFGPLHAIVITVGPCT